MRHSSPRRHAPGEDFRSMKLKAVRICRLDALGKFVEFLSDLLGLRLIDGHAAEDEIFLVWVVGGTGVV